jgi:type II secretory pathway pseudopilin PulG
MMDSTSTARDRRPQRGASLIDLMIAVTIAAIVLSFGVVSISKARDGMRLSTSAQVLRAYLDKARLASIRCHCATTVTISSTGGYTVSAPLKSATVETVNFPLEPNVNFQGLALPLTITFDWRGRPDNDYHLTLANNTGSKTVDLSGGGDIKLDSTASYTYAPAIQANLATDLSDASADSYVSSFANNNVNSNVIANPKNHKQPKK